jgi:geranylgeranyl diphosphate synthase type II
MNLQRARELVFDAWRQKRLSWHPKLQSLADEVVGVGKAFRPALLFWAQGAWSENLSARPSSAAIDAALALELIHTYSLVHDDLPAMDDDDFRRGRPTLHRLSSEATAILVGDALLTAAFEIIADSSATDALKSALILELSRAAGGAGMVGGQQYDIVPEKPFALVELERLHRLKTGALFGAAMAMASHLSGEGTSQLQARHHEARIWGVELGLLFQVADDIIDAGEEGPSFVSLMGLRKTKDYGFKLKETLAEKAKLLKLGQSSADILNLVFNRNA